MLPEVGATELLVIAAIALIVVGPKDLPVMLRKLGQFVARLRGMASEFRASFDEMARQSELDELRREVEAMRAGRSFDMLGADTHSERVFDEIDADLRGVVQPKAQALPEPEAKPKKPRAPRKKAEAPVAVVEAPKPKKPRAPRKKPETSA